MKNFYNKVIIIMLIVVSLFSFIACDNSVNASKIPKENEAFSIDGFKYENGIFTIVVEQNTSYFNFNNKININENQSYKIYKDIEGIFEISTKILSLDASVNICYIEVTDSAGNKNIYTVRIKKLPLPAGEIYYA